MEQLKEFVIHPVFLAGIFSWLSAQFIKTVAALLLGKIKDFKELISLLFWRTGGMPSSHSALVCSVSTSIGYSAGFTSNVFILSICFSMVVIRDSVGVRRASGLQAKAINEIGKVLQENELMEYNRIKEVHGHKTIEVIIGCLLGLFVGIGFSVL